MKLGVFDSGIGGEAVARSLALHFPEATITTVNDRAHVPYGDRSAEDIQQLTNTAIQPLLGSDIIVIACNTATAAAIDWLRKTYPTQLFIGLEPMVKTASAHTKTGTVAVCATPATLASERYHSLKKAYATNITILEPNRSSWARMIEDNNMNEREITTQISQLLEKNADVIVLGCTHYHWIKEDIMNATHGKAEVIDPSDAIANRVRQLLAT